MWWPIEAAANLTIALAYLGIALLITVPLVRMHQLSNKLAVATAAIFLSCSGGHFVHFLMPLMHTDAGMGAEHMSTWWSASMHTVTAGVALYYLSLRRLYGRLLEAAPMFHDLPEQQRLVELEAFRAATAARATAEAERDGALTLMNLINEHSPVLTYVKDLEGRYLMLNRAFEQTVGLPAADLLGHSYAVVSPELAAQAEEYDRAAYDGPVREETAVEIGGILRYRHHEIPRLQQLRRALRDLWRRRRRHRATPSQ